MTLQTHNRCLTPRGHSTELSLWLLMNSEPQDSVLCTLMGKKEKKNAVQKCIDFRFEGMSRWQNAIQWTGAWDNWAYFLNTGTQLTLLISSCFYSLAKCCSDLYRPWWKWSISLRNVPPWQLAMPATGQARDLIVQTVASGCFSGPTSHI